MSLTNIVHKRLEIFKHFDRMDNPTLSITTLLDIHITNLSNRKNVYSKNLIKIDEKTINLEIILTESIFSQIFIFY
jgi:hypothetical protein